MSDAPWYLWALAIAFVVVCGYGACRVERTNAAHRAAGDRCLRVSTAYIKTGDVLLPIETCAEWAPRRRGEL